MGKRKREKERDDGKRALQLAVSVASVAFQHAKCPKGVGLGGGGQNSRGSNTRQAAR